mmetsp:Transcript_53801/g.155279  ORF Transcript_53801/g.155279 Transcript_53801/m.155279 type:complete len:373 (-) Transcript_53801:111-1229(-)
MSAATSARRVAGTVRLGHTSSGRRPWAPTTTPSPCARTACRAAETSRPRAASGRRRRRRRRTSATRKRRKMWTRIAGTTLRGEIAMGTVAASTTRSSARASSRKKTHAATAMAMRAPAAGGPAALARRSRRSPVATTTRCGGTRTATAAASTATSSATGRCLAAWLASTEMGRPPYTAGRHATRATSPCRCGTSAWCAGTGSVWASGCGRRGSASSAPTGPRGAATPGFRGIARRRAACAARSRSSRTVRRRRCSRPRPSARTTLASRVGWPQRGSASSARTSPPTTAGTTGSSWSLARRVASCAPRSRPLATTTSRSSPARSTRPGAGATSRTCRDIAGPRAASARPPRAASSSGAPAPRAPRPRCSSWRR